MNVVSVRLAGGPADGTTRELPVGPEGGPPALWVLTQRHTVVAPEVDHLYERDPVPGPDGTWTMRWVRSDPVGMSE